MRGRKRPFVLICSGEAFPVSKKDLLDCELFDQHGSVFDGGSYTIKAGIALETFRRFIRNFCGHVQNDTVTESNVTEIEALCRELGCRAFDDEIAKAKQAKSRVMFKQREPLDVKTREMDLQWLQEAVNLEQTEEEQAKNIECAMRVIEMNPALTRAECNLITSVFNNFVSSRLREINALQGNAGDAIVRSLVQRVRDVAETFISVLAKQVIPLEMDVAQNVTLQRLLGDSYVVLYTLERKMEEKERCRQCFDQARTAYENGLMRAKELPPASVEHLWLVLNYGIFLNEIADAVAAVDKRRFLEYATDLIETVEHSMGQIDEQIFEEVLNLFRELQERLSDWNLDAGRQHNFPMMTEHFRKQ